MSEVSDFLDAVDKTYIRSVEVTMLYTHNIVRAHASKYREIILTFPIGFEGVMENVLEKIKRREIPIMMFVILHHNSSIFASYYYNRKLGRYKRSLDA